MNIVFDNDRWPSLFAVLVFVVLVFVVLVFKVLVFKVLTIRGVKNRK